MLSRVILFSVLKASAYSGIGKFTYDAPPSRLSLIDKWSYVDTPEQAARVWGMFLNMSHKEFRWLFDEVVGRPRFTFGFLDFFFACFKQASKFLL